MNLAAKTAKALAIALMLWCAGAGCMAVSYAQGVMRDMDAAADAVANAMSHMSGSMDAHACCKAKRRGAKRSNSATESSPGEVTESAVPPPVQNNAMSCCPLTTGSIVVTSRSQSDDEASTQSPPSSPAFRLLTSNQRPVAVPLRLPNRAESYLLDCVFLI